MVCTVQQMSCQALFCLRIMLLKAADQKGVNSLGSLCVFRFGRMSIFSAVCILYEAKRKDAGTRSLTKAIPKLQQQNFEKFTSPV